MSRLRVAFAPTAGAGGALWLLVSLGWIDEVALRVAVVMADPGHGEGQAVFVAALGDEIEEVVGADQNVQSAREA